MAHPSLHSDVTAGTANRKDAAMLYDFLKTNRPELISRCRAKVSKRRAPAATPTELDHGIPLFLDQLTEMLPGGAHFEPKNPSSPQAFASPAEQKMEDSASRHGQELLRYDFTIEQVVHDYGDLCQAITELAAEQRVAIGTEDFGILNIKLDNAIAGAVAEFSRRNRANDAASHASLAALVHEMRNVHNTTIVAITAIRHGTVGFGGATSAALDASLTRMGKLIDRTISVADAENETLPSQRIA